MNLNAPMLHRPLAPITVTLAILLTGCGGDHKGTDATTHDGTHGTSTGTSGEDTTGTTSGTTGGSTTPTTTAVAPPAAPTDLTAIILDGGVHLTWKDASDNEDNFIVENKADDEADFSVVIELPFDSVTYHDIDVMSGTNYTYRLKAVNAGGEALSNEAMIQIP